MSKKIDFSKLKPAPNKVQDVCKKCKAVIIYDGEDGYWDSLEKEEKSVKHYTPYCSGNVLKLHEPINFVRDENGYYFYKETVVGR